MKKTMIVLAVMAMMVTSASALSVNWSTGNMSALPGTYATDWQGQTTTFYLVASGYDLTGIISGLQNNNMSVLTGLTKDGSAALSGSTKYQAAVTGSKTDFVNGNPVYGFALVFNTGNAAAGTLDFAISSVKGGSFGIGNYTMNFGGAVGFVKYDVVPEPTSMALLALGVAAVGLRRKFIK